MNLNIAEMESTQTNLKYFGLPDWTRLTHQRQKCIEEANAPETAKASKEQLGNKQKHAKAPRSEKSSTMQQLHSREPPGRIPQKT